MRIAFFGVGHMGGPMAANLVKAGHEVLAFDLVPALLQEAVNAGASAADSPKQAVENAEVVISMLPSGAAAKGLYLGDDGILDAIGQDSLIIDCSTIDADTARRVASAAADSDHHGVTDEFSDTMATGKSCVSVKVSVKAKKKSFQPKMMQNIPATTNPGRALGRITRQKVVIGLQPSIHAISSSPRGTPLKKSTMTHTAIGISSAT